VTTEPCKHIAEYGKGAEFPIAASLEHFDECFTPERRLEAYAWMRERSEVGTRCLMAGHAEERALAEVATKLGAAIARRAAGEEIAVAIAEHRREFKTGSAIDTELFVAQEIALMVASPAQEAPSEPLTPSTSHSDLPEDSSPPHKPCDDPECPLGIEHSHYLPKATQEDT
jgi:hypothetical protein